MAANPAHYTTKATTGGFGALKKATRTRGRSLDERVATRQVMANRGLSGKSGVAQAQAIIKRRTAAGKAVGGYVPGKQKGTSEAIGVTFSGVAGGKAKDRKLNFKPTKKPAKITSKKANKTSN